MEYHHLGKSGLEVSRVGLGTIPYGTGLDEETARTIADRFSDAGGNYLDTANSYGGGMRGSHAESAGTSERTVGKIIKGRRDRFVVGTKGAWLMEDDMQPNAFGLSRTYLSTQIEASLRRLDTDYIDLYQCHVQDPYTPVEETMRVLDDFVRAGKVRYVGVSNWGGWQVVKANMHARQFNLTPIVSNQVWYNLADRVAEFAIVPACRDQGRVHHRLGCPRPGHPDRTVQPWRPGARTRVRDGLEQARGELVLGAAGGGAGLAYAGRTRPHRGMSRDVGPQRGHSVVAAER